MENRHDHLTKEKSLDTALEQSVILELSRYVEERVMNLGFTELYTLAGDAEALPENPRERLTKLYEFSRGGWNDRGERGISRQEADTIAALEAQKHAQEDTEEEKSMRQRREELILEAGSKIGFMEATYPQPDLDVGVVLGGANMSNKDRLAWLLENASPEIAVMTCSGRKLSDAERKNVAAFAPDATTEYELGVASAMAYFAEQEAKAGYQSNDHRIARKLGETELPQENGDVWQATQIRYWDERIGDYRDLLVAGSSEVIHDANGAPYKPDTYSNLEWLVKGMDLRPGMRVGVSTTEIFVPEQDVAAKAVLGSRGIDVTTFGYDAAYSGATRTGAQIQRGASVTLERLYFLQTQLDTLRMDETGTV